MRHIGIFPGVFDPVHDGHIAFGQAAIDKCNLDEVIFIPEAKPWHKITTSTIADRLAMLNLALASYPHHTALPLKTERFTTISLLAELRSRFPDTSFSLLVGSDVALTSLLAWQDIDLLLEAMSLIVGLRDTHAIEETSRALASIPAQITYLTTTAAKSKSTTIRAGHLVHPHPDVASYIQRKSLYT